MLRHEPIRDGDTPLRAALSKTFAHWSSSPRMIARGRPWCGGRWYRLGREYFILEFMLVPEQMQGIIQPSPDGHLAFRRWQWRVTAFKLEILRIQRNGVIVANLPVGFKTQNVLESDAIKGTVQIGQAVELSKVAIMLGVISLLQEAIGYCNLSNVASPQGFHQTILMRAMAAFDAALGLR